MLDLRQFTYEAARIRRKEWNIPVAVVTGSAGKTSVKELTGAILKTMWGDRCFMSPANKNTKIALASQVLTLPQQTQVAVFEMGARRRYDFEIPLSYLQPSIVALLNLGTAHIGEFGSLENLQTEKLSVLKCPSAEVLIVSGDDELILDAGLRADKKMIKFGRSEHCEVRLLDEELDSVLLQIDGRIYRFACSWQSSEKGINIAAAVAISKAFGAGMEAVELALRNFQGIPRRFELIQKDGISFIDDAFNASPESMIKGLHKVSQLYPDKKVLLILGSMLELGPNCQSAHRQVADAIHQLFGNKLECGSTEVITIGKEAKVIRDLLRDTGTISEGLCFENVNDAKAHVLKKVKEFEVVYLKGAKSVQLQKLLT
jgi:UDP-N-acetylmuramoyl-tripeptide--D-alanyl-D-alanine ligase